MITIRNNRGSIIVLVVIFSLIASLLGFGVLYMNGLEYLAARRDLMDERALLMAEGGLEVGRSFLYFCDARLEDKKDMDAAGGGKARDAVTKALKKKSKQYQVYGKAFMVDNDVPHATCEVWISPEGDNMATQGVYEYRITSKGVATYGFNGAQDSIKVEEMLITMSSVTLKTTDPIPSFASGWPVCDVSSCTCCGLRHLPGEAAKFGANPPDPNATRYFFKYDRDTGYPSTEQPMQKAAHGKKKK